MLLDSWLELAGGVVVVAGCVALVSVAAAPEEESEAAGVAPAGVVARAGSAFALPGVMVSTAAVLPMLEPATAGTFGCKLKPIVSSPDSLAGVMVGSPLRAAAE